MTEKIMLWNQHKNLRSYLKTFLIDTDEPRGAVLITPGGGYRIVCEPSEGAPVAKGFNALGLHAFVLNYRVFPDTYPAPQQDAMRALKIIRAHAEEWKVKKDQLGVCGFSAGGNLAATLGTDLVKNIDASDGDASDRESARPDFIICGQSVLSFKDDRNQATSRRWLGQNLQAEEVLKFSPERHVTADTPPTFLWHTFQDQVVHYTHSFLFAQALTDRNVPCELHIFPNGDHGILLGLDTPDVSQWQRLAVNFIATQTGPVKTPRQNYTHLHQCEASHTYPGELREE